MKNLNITIAKAKMSKLPLGTSVNVKWLYSLCTVLFFLVCSLTSQAQTDAATAVDLGSFTPGGRDYYDQSFYNSDYACVNNYGMDGNDYWVKVTVTESCYLKVFLGSTSGSGIFDTVLHLLDSDGFLLETNDDWSGASQGSNWFSSSINYYVSPGDYYFIIDGTSSKGHDANGGVHTSISVYH